MYVCVNKFKLMDSNFMIQSQINTLSNVSIKVLLLYIYISDILHIIFAEIIKKKQKLEPFCDDAKS